MAKVTPQIQAMINQYFPQETHPYRVLEAAIQENAGPEKTVLDIGCGRSAPILSALKGKVKERIGIDLIDFVANQEGMRLLNNDVCAMTGVDSDSIDLAYSRSVMEHIFDAEAAYAEIARTLRSGGKYIFITPNMWDYGSIISMLIPNRFHAFLVKAVEGRDEQDTFPAHYKSNTFRTIRKLAKENGLRVERIGYLGQYPNYFVFNRFLFWAGCKYEKFLERYPRLHWLRGWIICVLSKP